MFKKKYSTKPKVRAKKHIIITRLFFRMGTSEGLEISPLPASDTGASPTTKRKTAVITAETIAVTHQALARPYAVVRGIMQFKATMDPIYINVMNIPTNSPVFLLGNHMFTNTTPAIATKAKAQPSNTLLASRTT